MGGEKRRREGGRCISRAAEEFVTENTERDRVAWSSPPIFPFFPPPPFPPSTLNSLFLHLHQGVILQAAKAHREGPGHRGHEGMRQRRGVGQSHRLAQRRRVRLREAHLKRTMGRGRV